MAAERTWYYKGVHTKNLRVVYLKAQVLENFLEWQERLKMALEQVVWAEAVVKDTTVALGDANFTQKNHEDE